MTLEHLILLRHGETDWNVERRMQGHRDIGLNEAGRRQAVDAALSVAALDPQVIVSSDSMRARDTAATVAQICGLDVALDERLRETSMGDWEGLTRDEVVATWPGEWERWRTHVAARLARRAVSRAPQVARRAAEVVAELDAGDDQRALLVSHGGLIVGLTGPPARAAGPQLGDADRRRQLPLGDPAPVRRRLAAALLQRRARARRAASRRGRGRGHVAVPLTPSISPQAPSCPHSPPISGRAVRAST